MLKREILAYQPYTWRLHSTLRTGVSSVCPRVHYVFAVALNSTLDLLVRVIYYARFRAQFSSPLRVPKRVIMYSSSVSTSYNDRSVEIVSA